MTHRPRSRVAVVGIDGFSPLSIARYLDDSVLPALRALAARGVSISGEGPAYLRLRRYGMPRAIGGRAERGAVRRVHDGDAPVTVVAIGNLLDEALTAVRILADSGLPLDLFHVARIKPLDIAPILASARRTGLAIAIENHVVSGGGAQAVTAALAPRGVRVVALSLPDSFLPAGDPRWLLAHTGLDATSLAERIAAELVPEAA